MRYKIANSEADLAKQQANEERQNESQRRAMLGLALQAKELQMKEEELRIQRERNDILQTLPR